MGIGLGLRLYRLDQQSLWMDEDLAVRHLNAPDVWTYLQLLAVLVPEQAAGSVYFILQYLWARLFGDDMLVLRILPVLFGMGGVLSVFFLGNRLYGRMAGLLAASLMALSPMHIWHSQEVRPYELIMPVVALSMYALLKGLREERLRWWALNLMMNVILLWTHMFLMLFIGIQGFFLLIMVRRADWRRCIAWWGAHGFVSIVWILWLRMIMPYVHFFYSTGVTGTQIYFNTVGRDVVELNTDLLPPWKSFPAAMQGPWAARLLSVRPTCDHALLLVISVALAGFAGMVLWDWRRRKPSDPDQRFRQDAGLLLLVILGLSGPTLGLLENFFGRVVMNPMYSIFDMVALYIALGAFVGRLQPRAVGFAVGSVLLGLYVFQLALLLPQVTRVDWRAGAAYLRANAGAHDGVVRVQHFWPDHSFDYYMRDSAMPTRTVLTFQAACDDSARFLGAEVETTGDRRCVWIVFEQLLLEWVFPSSDPLSALKTDLEKRGLTCTWTQFPGHYNLVVVCVERTRNAPIAGVGDPVTPLRPVDMWLVPLTAPDYERILTEVGLGHLEGSGRQKALAALREAIDFWPIDDFPLSTKLFYMDPIFDLMRRGHSDVAEALARYVVAKHPSFGLGHFALGAVLAAQGEPDKALSSFGEARANYWDIDNMLGPFMDAVSLHPDRDRAIAEAQRLLDMGFAYAEPIYDTWKGLEEGIPQL